ncbi:NigD1/NigD2 family lipoprotein [Bacteroides caecigallinarum]|uniref:NigD1/NigD2 family lipoprotein n=1 Tax=Bacteroides caecigallinarum TaxID=1411144 RepID=UPI001956D85F|nr:NigD-like C-terminal domain-containing protein [Bacteroides caecigallinarum]MBM6883366.1 NigD-like N-terminal domain-containing protein [Bacteroides caecigallinarum]MCF2550621.1 NigD-like N-terminal domain-containing protein [Bacteroides caecigallinarum]
MKIRKTITRIISLCFIGTCMSACLDNEQYPELHSTMGTVCELDGIAINSDVYGKLIPNNPEIITRNDADSVGQRVLLNVNFPDTENKNSKENSGKEVTIYYLYKVLTKKADDMRVSASGNIDKFGNDPIQVTNAYISDEHLNLEFNITGYNETTPHRISLLLTENTGIDNEGFINVELRHNSNSDYGDRLYWGVVSFTLSSIPEYDNENVKGFKISYQSATNTKSEIKVSKQTSNQDSNVRSMKSTQEIGYGHSLLSGQLQ